MRVQRLSLLLLDIQQTACVLVFEPSVSTSQMLPIQDIFHLQGNKQVKFTFAGADRDLALGCGGGGGVEKESCGEVPTKWKFSMLWCPCS
jgi:hypothetical protein